MMRDPDSIFKDAITMLTYRRMSEVYDVQFVRDCFKDEKIVIHGFCRMGQYEYEFVEILLKLSPGPSRILDFGIPKSTTEDLTVVYARKGARIFHRPGLWELYLRQLAQEIEKDIENTTKLNGEPINDSSLFSKIPPD